MDAARLASLDAIFARARYGRAIGAIVAVPEEGGALRFERALHPLLLAEGAGVRDAAGVVPFDLELGERFDVLVISGPNTGGKTATLKAVGLLVLMALSGVPLPAQAARVPWFDDVHADVGDAQDLAQSLSTFSGHLRRIAELLRVATSRSLVLLDELGTGTEPKEGEALGRALLLELAQRGRAWSRRHLSGLKDLGFTLPRFENASLEFDAESLRPLFRLTLGLPGESNALKIARRHGIPPAILEAAEGFLHGGRGSEAGVATEQASRARRAALDHLEGAEQERRKAEAMRSELERRVAELEAKAKRLEGEKEAEIARALEATRERGRQLLAELGTLPARAAAAARGDRALPVRPPGGEPPLLARRAAYLASRKKGDTVFLPKYREHVVVRKVDRERRRITVLYRNLPLEADFDEVQLPDGFKGDGEGGSAIVGGDVRG
jgi:DNA mismatch repair protein MutS2